MNTYSLPQIWAACVNVLKDRINNRSVWEALEATKAIAIENDTLIIGLDASNSNRTAILQQGSNLNMLLRTVQEIFGQPLSVRFIEGTTVAEWEAVKERDARLAAARQQEAVRPVAQEVAAESWETVSEAIQRAYAQIPSRSLPQGKARYVNEALYLLAEAMETLSFSENDDAAERQLARILERVANTAEMPATALAFELERLRAWRSANPGR